MAKKKGSKRKPKEISKSRDADGVRELAAELNEVAQRLEDYAAYMEETGISSVRPLTGNFYLALERIRVFVAQQVLAKLVAEAARKGYDVHGILRPLPRGPGASRS